MKLFAVEPATGTERMCAECLEPATKFGYTQSRATKKINKSSRTPLCAAHATLPENVQA